MILRQRADAPAREHLRSHQPIGDGPRLVGRHDTHGQEVTGVGAVRRHVILLAVQGYGVPVPPLDPEGLIETVSQP
jgi:hypothetical protein